MSDLTNSTLLAILAVLIEGCVIYVIRTYIWYVSFMCRIAHCSLCGGCCKKGVCLLPPLWRDDERWKISEMKLLSALSNWNRHPALRRYGNNFLPPKWDSVAVGKGENGLNESNTLVEIATRTRHKKMRNGLFEKSRRSRLGAKDNENWPSSIPSARFYFKCGGTPFLKKPPT